MAGSVALLLMKERFLSIEYKQIEVRLGPGCGVQ